ncbi:MULTISPECIES: 16S rRNA (guanine(966)-N(2))-methyltransferase RsmD [Methylocaldum]|uniref:16S rRNA (guanine(966)-N(2))-methyltransferase RsmD n=1 Tax=unclassified Methylocaldum TaxID=2622260 RepID=UPI000989EF93|nr:16S rRNA (guanine(966)-N(2))-methyltransferase RsmD [Methylocaldum sp. 14B]MVF22843.1 16S rRNA (guanine(966)-N(2))-methyltransferase RsmD [Methylocaldum sp. BRCS4]
MKNELRIIAGRFRSRKLKFPDAPGLRPTPDRVRETLFNWLRNDIEGARCLDLYAGSGALGFEAASRGAAKVVQVERDALVCGALERNRALLNAEAVEIVQAEVGRFLEGAGQPFDVVFLDPPFHQGLVIPCCRALEGNGWLSSHAKIYVETESSFRLESLPENWRTLRDGRAGEVGYHLCERISSGHFP